MTEPTPLNWTLRSSWLHGRWQEAGNWRIQYRSYKDQSGFYLTWGRSQRMHDYPLILSEAESLGQKLQDVLDLQKMAAMAVIDYAMYMIDYATNGPRRS